MESNKNTIEVNTVSRQKLFLFFAAIIFIATVFTSIATAKPVIIFIAFVLAMLSLSYVLSFTPSVFLLSTVALSLPLSVIVEDEVSGISLIFPSELLAGVVACVMIIKLFSEKKTDTSFLFHPISLLIGLFILGNIVSVFFSNLILVSVKAVFVKCVYICAFFIASYKTTKSNYKNAFLFFLCYMLSLAFVVTVTLYKHSLLDFDKSRVLSAVLPFYKDHTIYSACLAFAIPLAISAIGFKTSASKFFSCFAFLLTMLFSTGLFFSYSRASIASIFFLFICYIFLKLKFKLRWALLVLVGVSLTAWLNKDSLAFYFTQNKNNSNERYADLEKQAKSITSISADESNAERINRWNCAIRMFIEKPFKGFGPGTYQFEYLTFQRYYDITRISVFSQYQNIQQGRGGTAHSEYLLVLSECGIFTFSVFVLLCFTALLKGRKIYFESKNKFIKQVSLAVTLGLITYLFHGMFNNFLDTDKAAFLFYTALGMLVGLDNNSQKAIINGDKN